MLPVPLHFRVLGAGSTVPPGSSVTPSIMIELIVIGSAAMAGLAWAVWMFFLFYGIVRKKIAFGWLIAITYAVISCGLSILSLYCYLYDEPPF